MINKKIFVWIFPIPVGLIFSFIFVFIEGQNSSLSSLLPLLGYTVVYLGVLLPCFSIWNPEQIARGGLVLDSEMALLHEAGEAKEFEIKGTYTFNMNWESE